MRARRWGDRLEGCKSAHFATWLTHRKTWKNHGQGYAGAPGLGFPCSAPPYLRKDPRPRFFKPSDSAIATTRTRTERQPPKIEEADTQKTIFFLSGCLWAFQNFQASY